MGGFVMSYSKIEFKVIEGWEKLLEGWSFVEVVGVVIDLKDCVYVFNWGEYLMIVFDVDGWFLNVWGEGVFNNVHGIYIGCDDWIYCVDNGDYIVCIFIFNGKLFKMLGEKDVIVYGKELVYC